MNERLNASAASSRRERLTVWIVTLAYTVLTLLNLGTLSFPTSEWSPRSGERVVLDLGQETEVGTVWFNSNIGTGTLRLCDDSGMYVDYQQSYAEMFTWRKKPMSFTTRYLTLEVMADPICLNEIAIFDTEGRLLPVSVFVGSEADWIRPPEAFRRPRGYRSGNFCRYAAAQIPVMRGCQCSHAELFAHTISCYHCSRELCCLLYIICRSCCHRSEYQFFRCSATGIGRYLILYFLHAHEISVVFFHLQCIAKRA